MLLEINYYDKLLMIKEWYHIKKSTFIIGIVITAVICIVGTSYGCNIEDNNKYTNSGNTNYIFGYWTSTAVVGISNGAWGVSRCGYLDNGEY